MRTLLTAALLLLPALLDAPARADEADPLSSPVGRWRTIDDKTGKAKSVISIREEGGRLYGKIEQILDPKPDDPDPRCVKCGGEQKDQPILGLQILSGFRKDGERWSGGKVLDPENGKTYSCNMGLVDGGHKLQVRGFVGIALIGRTQTWIREE
jgi:uncharacterized protein (DUF2147 family)